MPAIGAYIRLSKAWNAQEVLGSDIERISISRNAGRLPAGEGELSVAWTSVEGAPQLRVRYDAWESLVPEFSGLLRHMAHLGSTAKPEEYCALLTRLGFADATERFKPAADTLS